MSAMVDGFVGFEREKERKRGRYWVWGAAMDDGEIFFFFSEKLDFDCVCLGLLFYL